MKKTIGQINQMTAEEIDKMLADYIIMLEQMTEKERQKQYKQILECAEDL